MNAETEKALLQLQCLKSAVKQAVADTDNAMQQPGIDPGEKAYIDALKDRLTGELENIENVETLIQGERKLTVGVFGFPSRGKSTLLNALLGTDMLPMDGRPGTTRLGTMLIKNEPKNYRSAYRIRRIFKGAALEDGVCRAEDVGTILNYFSSTESGEKNLKTQRIEIEGPFDSFIDDDLIFIDTPAIVEESVSSSDTGHDWERDRKYALEILSTVDIVIFCIRADAPEKNEVKLYNETFFDKYEPINVITFANERDDDMTILDLKRYLKETYHLMLPDTVAVDAKKAV
ncbi:MAG: dynamin family protein, partial [Spirochaetes bacterium]|nr:dynamin family protein [Spirochaetota bacterium]